MERFVLFTYLIMAVFAAASIVLAAVAYRHVDELLKKRILSVLVAVIGDACNTPFILLILLCSLKNTSRHGDGVFCNAHDTSALLISNLADRAVKEAAGLWKLCGDCRVCRGIVRLPAVDEGGLSAGRKRCPFDCDSAFDDRGDCRRDRRFFCHGLASSAARPDSVDYPAAERHQYGAGIVQWHRFHPGSYGLFRLRIGREQRILIISFL